MSIGFSSHPTTLTSTQGGTWFENTYPGIRCDIPAHAYQSGFAPNTQWSEEFAQGAEIRDYWQIVARKYNVYQYLRPRQQVHKAEWLADEGKWKVTIQHLDGSNKVSQSPDRHLKVSFLIHIYFAGLRRKLGRCHQRHRPFQCLETARIRGHSDLQRRPLPFI